MSSSPLCQAKTTNQSKIKKAITYRSLSLYTDDKPMHQKRRIDARVENLEIVLDYLSGCIEKLSCLAKVQIQLAIAVEEIFVNIAHYAYDSGKARQVLIRFETEKDSCVAICSGD